MRRGRHRYRRRGTLREPSLSENAGEVYEALKRPPHPLDFLIALALCGAGFGLGQFQNSRRAQGQIDPVTSTVRSVVLPATGLVARVGGATSDWLRALGQSGSLEAQNRALRAELNGLAIYRQEIDDRDAEIEALRRLQGFGPVPGKERVPGLVIAYAPYENQITLGVGSDLGVTPGAPVICVEGLVGTVLSVEPNRCQVSLLSNPALTIGAIDIHRKPPSAGLFRAGAVTFDDPQAPVEAGDMVVTTGFSEKIPRGIIIGKVIFVDDNPAMGTRRALIDPAVSVGDLREVQVLR